MYDMVSESQWLNERRRTARAQRCPIYPFSGTAGWVPLLLPWTVDSTNNGIIVSLCRGASRFLVVPKESTLTGAVVFYY